MEKYINTRINGVDCTFYATSGNFYEMTLENNYLHVCMSYDCGRVGGVAKDVEGFCTESFNDENSFDEAIRLLKEWALISYESMCDIINAWRDFVASVVEEFHNFAPDIRVADVRGYGYKQDAPEDEKIINEVKTNTEVEANIMNENAIIKGYITNLGKYNEGVLAYKLISFPIDDAELSEALKSIGCKYVDENGVVHNPLYEEFFFSDWECEIPFDFGEYENIADVNDYAERVEALSAYEQEYLCTILEEYTSNAEEALRIVEDGDYTIWNDCDTMADVAATMAEEYGYLNSIPERLQCYIDYEKWGRALDLGGTFLEGDGYFVEIF